MKLNKLVLTIIKRQVKSKTGLEKLKKEFAKKEGISLPKNYQLIKAYQKLVEENQTKRIPWLEEILISKPVRTLSGVTPLTVLLQPFSCPGKCLYCPDQGGVPKSYLADEPAVLRARQFNYDPQKQVKYRLDVFKLMGHRIAKIELIILGGSFSHYPRGYRQSFLQACFDAANLGQKSATLSQAQKANEKAQRKIIGITIETRPDLINPKEIEFLRKLGVTRVELGVQSLSPSVLKKIRRGHGLKEVIQATRLLKDAGFKVCYHLMPGLPGSSFKKDIQMFQKIFTNSRFQPDFLKIYPCVVLKDAPLYHQWQKGNYQPLTDQELVKLLVAIKKNIPSYVRINRLGRDIPVGNIIAGYRYSHIRQLAQKQLKKEKKTCQCIRCREIKTQAKTTQLKLEIIDYPASRGQEYFLQFVDRQNRLSALLRLRLPPKNSKPFFPVLKNTALVRELHTYGQSLALGERKLAPQHRGLGKKLLKKAEAIAQERGFEKIAVISGIGVRPYYRALGYQLRQTYMLKTL